MAWCFFFFFLSFLSSGRKIELAVFFNNLKMMKRRPEIFSSKGDTATSFFALDRLDYFQRVVDARSSLGNNFNCI